MQPEQARTRNPDIRDALTTLRRRKWTIILVVAIVLASTIYLSSRKTPIYKSTARVLVRAIEPPNANSFFFGEINLDTESGLARSQAVASIVDKSLQENVPPDSLLGGLSVTVEPSTEILDVTYSDPDPQRAAKLANAFADGYLEFRVGRAQEEYDREAADIHSQIDETSRQLTAVNRRLVGTKNAEKAQTLQGQATGLNSQLLVLQSKLNDLSDPTSVPNQGGEVVQPAAVPSSPSSPNHGQDAALAIVIGLALGCGIALARDQFDSSIRGRQDLENALGAPVLGTIPKVDGWKKRQEPELVARDAPRSGAAEAYRALRANLQFLSREEDVSVIAVTSPHLGDGKTTTVANIAVTLAQSGKRVIAVSCDLRKPRLHKFFGLTNDIGVSSVLTGEARAPDATLNPQEKNLRILPSGPIPENPAELLGSDAMQALIDMLKDSADFVIIDTPPLMAVADALIVGPRADGVIVVVDASNTKLGAASSVREQLQQVGTRILGGVINSFDAGQARYESEEYRYHYYYEYREDKTPAADGKTSQGGGDVSDPSAGNGQANPSKTEDIWS